MWIRSQDDRLLIDEDKIYVGGTDKCQIYNIGESFNYFLGNYSSLEKAVNYPPMNWQACKSLG